MESCRQIIHVLEPLNDLVCIRSVFAPFVIDQDEVDQSPPVYFCFCSVKVIESFNLYTEYNRTRQDLTRADEFSERNKTRHLKTDACSLQTGPLHKMKYCEFRI